MHIHVFMLCRNFEMIPIKIIFFMNFHSCLKIGPKTLYRDFDEISSKMTRREFSIFITFSDTYACTYVV